MRKLFYIFLFVFALILASSANAQPTFQTINSGDEGLEIAFTSFDAVQQNQDFELNLHIFNKSNGIYMTGDSVDCELDIYAASGTEIFDSALSYTDEFYLNISAGNFSDLGEYAYIIQCNSTSLGGFVFGNFYITKTGDDQEFLEIFGLMTIGMIIGLGIVAFLFLYFAFQLTQDHFILKIFLTFFAIITIGLIPAVAMNGYDGLGVTFLKITTWFFRIFVTYFSIYIFWHWCQKSEKMMSMINKAKSAFKRR